MGASPTLISVVEALWQAPRPGPNNLLAAAAFTAVSDVCRADYGGDKPVFALSTAVRSLGVPCWLPAGHASLSVVVLTGTYAAEPLAAGEPIMIAIVAIRFRRRNPAASTITALWSDAKVDERQILADYFEGLD